MEVNGKASIDSPGLCFARPPSLRLRRKKGIFFEQTSFPLAEERVDQRSAVWVSRRSAFSIICVLLPLFNSQLTTGSINIFTSAAAQVGVNALFTQVIGKRLYFIFAGVEEGRK
jgi:hypothetical protein